MVEREARGLDILRDPLLNKGTAFNYEERKQLNLEAYLPPHVSSMKEQLCRRYQNFEIKNSRIEKYEFLSDLQNRNEILFYRFVLEHIDEMLPYVYTPTVGDASLLFSIQYHQSRGLFISCDMKDRIEEILQNTKRDEVEVIVVTDGERILGLGDVGVGGMVIPVGKLALYTIFGGIHPSKLLPIFIDVGTDNEKLLSDPLYIGRKSKRIRDDEYSHFLETFVSAVKKVYPNVLLQWEDFARENAESLLTEHQSQICSFNDDIQGTAAVTLAGLLAALKRKKSTFMNEKIGIYGAGSAGIGIANIIVDYMEHEGHSREEACRRIYIFDRRGLVHEGLTGTRENQKPYVRTMSEINQWSVDENRVALSETVEFAEITILVGVSAHKDGFDESVIKKMRKNTDQPIIFPLSNPNSKAEATPKQLYDWAGEKVIVATGSPFPPVEYKGKTHPVAQCNNVYIFPAMGLAAATFKIKKITQKQFLVAAKALSEKAAPFLFPPLSRLREVTCHIAEKVGECAMEEGLADHIASDKLRPMLEKKMWFPSYS